MSEFTPFSAMIGGMLIGGSAALLLLLIGRIAGITGIIGGILQPARGELGWRLAFVAGLLMAPVIHTGAGGALPPVEITSSTSLLILAGVLVGVGTRLSQGCTSGHGVCGIGRGSPRSVAATAVFVTTAVLTVFVTRHVAGM